MELLLKNGTIYPVTSEPFKGDILIEDGKIKKVGTSIKSKKAEVIDLEGKFVFPGFVDAHSHIGLFEEGVGGYYQDGNEGTDPVTPQVRAIDAFFPNDIAMEKAIEGGVTTTMIVPGSANPIGGQGAIIKFRSRIVDEMIIREPAGLKIAFGENPKRFYGEAQKKTPSTRLGTAAVIRDFFVRSQNYMKKKETALKENKDFDIDMKLEMGVKVLKKEMPVRAHAHRMDDILTAIRIKEEFGFDLVIEHATEGYKIADYLKEKDIPVVLGPLLSFATKLELRDKTYDSLRIANEKGLLAAVMCDHPVVHLEHTTLQLAFGLRYGAKEEDLLKMITINPAKILKMEDRIGSIEAGKDADLTVWTGHPFDMRAKIEKVYIDGRLILDK